MNQKSLDKKKTSDVRNKVVKPNKTKELDWHIKWDYLLNKKKWKNPDEVNKVLTKFVEDLLTQQISELLEEILEQNKDDMTGLYDYDGIAETVISLLNKKDE